VRPRRPATWQIETAFAADPVVAGPAHHAVGAEAPEGDIFAAVTGELVGATAAGDAIVAITSSRDIRAFADAEDVVAGESVQDIVAIAPLTVSPAAPP